MNIVQIKIKDIVPDEGNPRKNFPEDEMALLRKSIEKYGIKRPLDLEVSPDGTYIIEDGERRFRAAKELGLKDVPAILHELRTPIQRRIEQFHIQQTQKNWSNVEMAMSITEMAELMNETVENMAKILGIGTSIVRDSIAFGKLVDKKQFQKNNISLRWAEKINGTRSFIYKIARQNDIEADKRDIEIAIYARMSSGEEVRGSLFTNIKDSVRQMPAIITEFIENPKMTSDEMFKKSKAKGATYLRQVETYAHYLTSALNNFMKEKSVKVTKESLDDVKMVVRHGKEFIDQFGA